MGSALEIWEKYQEKRKTDYGLENALAKFARNKWQDKTIAYVAHEWDLTDSEASKVVYAAASKNTLNKLLHHKRGGFGLFLQLLEDVTATKLESFVHQQAERAADERRAWEAEERRLATLRSRISSDDFSDRGGDQPPG